MPLTGDVEEAESIAEQLRGLSRTRYVARSGLAAIDLARGDVDRGLEQLECARTEGDWYLGWSRADPRWNLRDGRRLQV